jgi:hypothetical protein
MNKRTGHRRIALASAILASLAIGALLLSCGGTDQGSALTTLARKPAARIPARYVGIVKRNMMACERAVQAPPGLSAEAKNELAALCFRVNYIPEDNERTVRAACEEAANASSVTGDARKRAAQECYVLGFVR